MDSRTTDGGAPAAQSCAGPEGAMLQELLVKTSRTFALSIPVLPEPTRREVTVAYLLFRIADTLEDATSWDRERKIAELDQLADLLRVPTVQHASELAAQWTKRPPLEHAGYIELLDALPLVLGAHMTLQDPAREQIRDHTLRTIEGMSGFVSREEDGVLELRDVEDLQTYCYAVAGIVGEMLTELFVLGRESLEPVASDLRADSATFGEALQLVNILKDSASDLTEGRCYLPRNATRAEVFALAREDLAAARRYSLKLWENAAPRGVVEFTMLPILLAQASLDRIEADGPGSKITREDVQRLVLAMQHGLDSGNPQAGFPSAD